MRLTAALIIASVSYRIYYFQETRQRWTPKVNFTEGLVNTSVSILHQVLPEVKQETDYRKRLLNIWDTPKDITADVLVILIGQGRGGEYAWKSLKKNVLEPLHADLATYFTAESKSDMLQSMARYSWQLPEYDDWGVAMDKMSSECEVNPGQWRKLCEIPGIMLGGVNGCGDGGSGSGGILLAFRHAVSQKLTELALWEKYKYFILTRADHVYLCTHPNPSTMDQGSIWVPEGESYGGFTDRHLVATSSLFRKAIDFKQTVLCHADEWFSRLSGQGGINLEILLQRMWAYQGLSVKSFPRCMFAVRMPGDKTRWSQGSVVDSITQFGGMTAKYTAEIGLSEAYCKISAEEGIKLVYSVK